METIEPFRSAEIFQRYQSAPSTVLLYYCFEVARITNFSLTEMSAYKNSLKYY